MEKEINQIIDRLKTLCRTKTDGDLAKCMGVPLRRLQTWKSRNSIPYKEITSFCDTFGYDLNYVLLNRHQPGDISSHIIPPEGRSKTEPAVESNQIVTHLCFSHNWIKHGLNMDAPDILLVRISTNNMSPWVTEGDLVVVNTARTTIVNDSPYILIYEYVTLVPKRLIKQTDGTIIAKSDSQYCEDEIYPPDTTPPRILGRIVRRFVR